MVQALIEASISEVFMHKTSSIVWLFVIAVVVWQLLRMWAGLTKSKKQELATPYFSSADAANCRTADGRELPSVPHSQGTFFPSTGLIYSNAPEAFSYECDSYTVKYLPLHRPTFDPALDKSGDYPYGDHFKGRKRLWENRLQFVFKEVPSGPLMFGIELENYVPLSFATKRAMDVTVSALKRCAGKDLYHSPGDDPKIVMGERERPVFVMPLWAFDQLIITEVGEEPPNLNDPKMNELGIKRADDLKLFMKTMSELKIRVGVTYTLNFWGIAQFLDNLKWEVKKVVPGGLCFNKFCGAPPVHVVMYTLKAPADGKDKRHLDSRKTYYLRVAFWSSPKPPPARRVEELLHECNAAGANPYGQRTDDAARALSAARARSGRVACSSVRSWLACF